MSTDASPKHLGKPDAIPAAATLHRAVEESLGDIVGKDVVVTLNERRAIEPDDGVASAKNVMVEFQGEWPAGGQHSVVVLVDYAELIQLVSIELHTGEPEIVDAESLLGLGDSVSAFLDNFASRLTWLEPAPRIWLANLEPIVPAATDDGKVELPATIGGDGPLSVLDVTLSIGDEATCSVQLIISERSEQALFARDAPMTAPVPRPPLDVPAQASAPTPLFGTPAPEHGKAAAAAESEFNLPRPGREVGRSTGFDLVKDVPLHITVELGRASLTVREILGLGVGSVVELDRLAGEPVDVLANDRLIGRGEVVIVDESFGVCLTEVFRESRVPPS